MSREIYCIGYSERQEIVADWYTSAEARGLFLGSSGKREVIFSFPVGREVDDERISEIATDMAWFRLNFPVAVDEDASLELQ